VITTNGTFPWSFETSSISHVDYTPSSSISDGRQWLQLFVGFRRRLEM